MLDGRSYWLAERALPEQVAQSVCVIGSGETAASVVISLLNKAHKRSTIDVLTSRGSCTRAGRATTRTASTPIPATGRGWPSRTGASSSSAPTAASSRSRPRRCSTRRAASARSPGGRCAIEAGERQVVVTIEYGGERERVAYDLVVVAIGFDARWFEGLLGGEARRRLDGALAGD